jgi:tetratricopeptide (TPR) repeat protein
MPFAASTRSDAGGGFRFRNLPAGPYSVVVFVPGRGEIEQTVVVGPSQADANGRVTVRIRFPEGSGALEAVEKGHKVTLRELKIPDSARRELSAAERLLGKQDVEGAIRRLERAVEIAPQFTEAWNSLGTIAYQTHRHEDAEKFFRKALEHDPGAFYPAVNLGGVLLNLEKPDEALKYNLYAVGERPRDALANVQTGMSYFYLGQYDQAVKYLLESKRLDPSHFSHPQLFLAHIYLRRSDRNAAIAELEDFLRRYPDAPQAAEVRADLGRLRAP